MFITPAFAQGATDSAGGVSSLLGSPIVLLPFMIAIVYFLMWRPQQKRMKEHQDMIASIRRGHTIVTAGGILGKVAKVRGDEIDVDIAPNVRVVVLKSSVTAVRAKGEPVRSKADDDDEDGGEGEDGSTAGGNGGGDKSGKAKQGGGTASARMALQSGPRPLVIRGPQPAGAALS
jgi:preprotein translocase subunit YajC